ncbi:MAG: hypothetical protein AAGC73_01445 [Verrucomicrobiota bacterium]
MKYRTTLFFLILAVLSSAFLTGCREEGLSELENPAVPRLLLEPRGLNYGSPGSTGKQVRLPVSGSEYTVSSTPLVDEFEILNVELVKVDLGMALMFQLSDKAARALYRASVSSIGSVVVLMINGNAIGARRLDGAISDGNYFTFVELSPEDMEQLVLDIKATIVQLQKSK